MARAPLPESKLRARRRRRLATLASVIGFSALAFFGGLVYLSWRPFLRINEVRVEGAQTVATSTLEKFVRERLSGTFLGVFPRDNVFLYGKSGIVRDVSDAYPLFSDVSVEASSLTGIVVAVSERQPAALWCGESPDAPQPCLYVDSTGAAYAQAPAFSGSPYARYYGALPAVDLPRQFLSPERFSALGALIKAFAGKAGEAQNVSVEDNGDVFAMFEEGFVVRFALADDAAKIFQRFTLALESAPFVSHKLSDFSYLDLRFGDKLYYKLK